MAKNQKYLLFLIALFIITGVFLFSVPRVWARNPIDIDIGLNLNTLIADHVNDLAGREVIRFIPHSVTNDVNINTNSSQGNTVTGSGEQVAGASIAKVAGTATGTTGSLALSTALSLLIALFYMAYVHTDLFQKREVSAIIKKQRLDKNRFNFAS